MSIVTRWPMLLAASRCPAFLALLRSIRYQEKQAHKAELHEWENEGGNLAPVPEAPNTVLTTSST
jgi:hypothetical protein